MEHLLDILNEGRTHVKVEMSAEDLKAFSDDLIRRAKEMSAKDCARLSRPCTVSDWMQLPRWNAI